MTSSNDTLNLTPNSEGDNSKQSARKPDIETFKVRRGLSGWHLIPADPERHPLLVRLFGHTAVDGVEPQKADWEELRRPVEWESLDEGLRLIRQVAKDAGLGVRICGNVNRAPTVQLWRIPEQVAEPLRKVFAGLGGDAAKWGVSDFYEEHEKLLRDALASKAPFDTGWYSVKKEIQTGRIWRERRAGLVRIEVSASMDDWPDLIDTAVWAAMGKHLSASSGFDVLTKLGLSDEDAQAWMERAVDEEVSYSELGPDNSWNDEATLSPRVGYDRLCEALDRLMDTCESALKTAYDGLVESCRARLASLKKDLGSSCTNCKHFHPGIGASRSSPEYPADCGHPRYYALLSANKAFPFEHGCKFWVARYPMKRQD